MSQSTWKSVALALYRCPEGAVLRVPKIRMEHPSAGGLHPALAVPRGQLATFQRTFQDGSSLWVRDFGSHYDASIQRHTVLAGDAVTETNPIAAGLAAGSIVGALLGRTSTALLIGAALGGAFAALANSSATPDRMSDRGEALGTS